LSKKLKPMTKEELETLKGFPEVHKKAIELSILNWCGPDDPEDKVWPDYYRAEEVEALSGCEIFEADKLDDAVAEYDTDCVWFQSGWKAALNALKALKRAKQASLL